MRGPEPDAPEIVVARTIYGEALDDPLPGNFRGAVYATYDGAGVVRSDGFDFKGNPLGQTRRFAVEYRQTLDWSALDAGAGTVAAIEAAAEPLLRTESFGAQTVYDGLSRPLAQTSADGSVTELAYDDGGQLLRVDVAVRDAAPTAAVVAIEYDVRGRRSSIVYGNGTRTRYRYDERTLRLVQLRTTRDADAAVLQDLQYTYDPVGNITEIADGAQPEVFFNNTVVSGTQRFEYDARYRLREASGREHIGQAMPSPSERTPGPHPDVSDPAAMRAYVQRYAFDAVGNLTQMQHEAVGGSWTRQYTYADDGNRLLHTQSPGDPPGLPLSYDAAGNMTSMPHLQAMVWDHGERLRQVDLGGGGTAFYVYDAGGARVRKVIERQSGSQVRERLYLGALEVYRERSGEVVQLERQTLHVADDAGRVALVDTQTIADGAAVSAPVSRWRFQYSNHLGSTALELDASAQVISYEEFHPFGTASYRAVDASVDVPPRRYRYISKERDAETGLDLMGARYYVPWLGRWTAADPIGLGDGVNRYAYVHGNPIALSDPRGTFAGPPSPKPGFEHLGMLVTTGRGSGGKGPTVLYSEDGDPGEPLPAQPDRRRAEAKPKRRKVSKETQAKREELVLDMAIETATKQYEGLLRQADAQRVQELEKIADRLGFYPTGRVVSDFEPGQMRGPSRVDKFHTALWRVQRATRGQPFEDRVAALEEVQTRALQRIDWRGDAVEDIALTEAAFTMGATAAAPGLVRAGWGATTAKPPAAAGQSTSPNGTGATPGDGAATGRGGQFRDANGRLRNANGTFAPDGGRKPRSSNSTHGNTAGDQEAVLYERYDADGNFLKHGISQDPSRRYSQRELDGGFLIETQRGPRREILKVERELVETNPGPLNREPWAGKRRKP